MIIHFACSTNSWADRDLVLFGSSIGPTCGFGSSFGPVYLGQVLAQFLFWDDLGPIYLGRVSTQHVFWGLSQPNFSLGPVQTQLILGSDMQLIFCWGRFGPYSFWVQARPNSLMGPVWTQFLSRPVFALNLGPTMVDSAHRIGLGPNPIIILYNIFLKLKNQKIPKNFKNYFLKICDFITSFPTIFLY